MLHALTYRGGLLRADPVQGIQLRHVFADIYTLGLQTVFCKKNHRVPDTALHIRRRGNQRVLSDLHVGLVLRLLRRILHDLHEAITHQRAHDENILKRAFHVGRVPAAALSFQYAADIVAKRPGLRIGKVHQQALGGDSDGTVDVLKRLFHRGIVGRVYFPEVGKLPLLRRDQRKDFLRRFSNDHRKIQSIIG